MKTVVLDMKTIKKETNGKKNIGEEKVMKTNFKNIAAGVLGLITISVSAQGISKNSTAIGNHETIFVKTEQTSLIAMNSELHGKSRAAATMTVNLVTEEALKLESWMLNENNFNTYSLLEEATDEKAELENWMINEKLFEVTSISIIEETDSKLEVENWMLNEKAFEVKSQLKIITNTGVFTEMTDAPLTMKSWMLDTNFFR